MYLHSVTCRSFAACGACRFAALLTKYQCVPTDPRPHPYLLSTCVPRVTGERVRGSYALEQRFHFFRASRVYLLEEHIYSIEEHVYMLEYIPVLDLSLIHI